MIEALRRRLPEVEFEGIGGPLMVNAGCHSTYPMERLSVMGLSEAALRYLELLPVRARLARNFIKTRPDVFVGIDAPDFNLDLELRLRRAGIRTAHYVSPSVWAWRTYRMAKIKRAVDLMLTLFPFEQSFYARHGMQARFVGHPVADAVPMSPDRAAARRRLGLPPGEQVVVLLPGSRLTEVRMLAAPMAGAARWLSQRRERLHFIAPFANLETQRVFELSLARHAGDVRVDRMQGESWSAMAAADVVLLASGTASLEAMLHKRPMVITYRTRELTWQIGRRMLHVDHVGLPNLLAGRALVPELLQTHAVPERMGAEVLAMLEQPRRVARLQAEFSRIHAGLRNQASERAAEAVLELARR